MCSLFSTFLSIYKMKSVSRLYSGLNTFLKYLGIRRIPFLQCASENYYGRHLQSVSLNHKSRTFEGPSFRDFLVNEQNSKEELEGEDHGRIPYINELDLNGDGRKVYFEVQGCQMNVNDIELVWSILKEKGYEKTTKLEQADIYLIITCAIRDSAELKIWSKVSKIKSLKKQFHREYIKIGILGCMAERLKDKILEIDKAVDLIAGPDSYKDLPRLLALTRNGQKAVNIMLSLDETYADVLPVRLDESNVTAFVSIMRGCDNMCTYCIVPFTRGRERSRPIKSIVDEVKMLSEQGVKQITLLGQNVNSYRDLSLQSGEAVEATKLSAGFNTVYKTKKGGLRFDVLLDKVSLIDPNMRIRFTAPHPKDFPDEVLHLIRERKNICCGLHLPAQSGSNAVLERMRRGHTREAYLDLVDRIRSIVPDVCLTTDIITGFCGETEEDHEETLDLIKRVKYSFVYFYPYSMREKTTAHRRYVDDVPHDVKIRRLSEIENIFRAISRKLNEAQVKQTQLVLVEGFSKKSKEFLQGRNDGNTKVIIPCRSVPAGVNSAYPRPIRPGDYVAVEITEGNSLLLKGAPLYHTTLVDFVQPQYVSRSRQKDLEASA